MAKHRMKALSELLKHSFFHHQDIETGAPALYSYAPLGNKNPIFVFAIADILGLKKPESENDVKNIANYYIDYCINFPSIIKHIKFSIASYAVPDIQKIIHGFINQYSEKSVTYIEQAISDNFRKKQYLEKITVTELHLTMLYNFHWQIEYNHERISTLEISNKERENLVELLVSLHSWALKKEGERFNIPIICADPKRPFGNRVYYYWDLEDLNIPTIKADGEYDKETGRRLFSNNKKLEIDQIKYESSLVLQAISWYAIQ